MWECGLIPFIYFLLFWTAYCEIWFLAMYVIFCKLTNITGMCVFAIDAIFWPADLPIFILHSKKFFFFLTGPKC